MRLDVSEAGALQGPVRRDVEGVGLTEEAFQRQLLEIELGGLANARCTDPRSTSLWIDDMQVHMGVLAEDDLVGGRKADRNGVELPDHKQRGPVGYRLGEVVCVALSPILGRRQARGVYTEQLQVLGRGAVEVVDYQLRLAYTHLPDDERHGYMIAPAEQLPMPPAVHVDRVCHGFVPLRARTSTNRVATSDRCSPTPVPAVHASFAAPAGSRSSWSRSCSSRRCSVCC